MPSDIYVQRKVFKILIQAEHGLETGTPWGTGGLGSGIYLVSLPALTSFNSQGTLWGHFRPIFPKQSAARKRGPGSSFLVAVGESGQRERSLLCHPCLLSSLSHAAPPLPADQLDLYSAKLVIITPDIDSVLRGCQAWPGNFLWVVWGNRMQAASSSAERHTSSPHRYRS